MAGVGAASRNPGLFNATPVGEVDRRSTGASRWSSPGLSRSATDWKWSSARWYQFETKLVDPDLPTIHGLPWDFF